MSYDRPPQKIFFTPHGSYKSIIYSYVGTQDFGREMQIPLYNGPDNSSRALQSLMHLGEVRTLEGRVLKNTRKNDMGEEHSSLSEIMQKARGYFSKSRNPLIEEPA